MAISTDQAQKPSNPTTAAQAILSRPAAGQGQQATPDAPAIPRKQYPTILIDALRSLLAEYERQCDRIRRNHLRRMLEGEEFWKGNHYPIWSESAFSFRTPFEQLSYLRERKPESMPTRVYITNLYRAHGASVISVLSEKLPKVRFLPKNSENQIDIATAKAASTVAELIERNNSLGELAKYGAYMLWTQGLYGAYVRYVLDEEFGEHEEPLIEQKQIQVSPDQFSCAGCGLNTETGQGDNSMLSPMNTMTCPGCGSDFRDSDFYPAQYAMAPVVSGSYTVPDGQERIDLYGGVHIKLMPWAKKQRDSGYLILAEEAPIGMLRDAYPWVADNIREGGGEAQEGASNTYEHLARQRLYDASQPYGNRLTSAMSQGTCTFKRVWFRRWALAAHKDPVVRAALLETFPNGVFVAFAGDTFLEAREERLDEHWQIFTAMPSQGIYADGLGGDTIPMNKVIDDNLNLAKEQMEYAAAPPIAVDARYVNTEALNRKRMRAGSFFPVGLKRDGGKSLQDLFFQPQFHVDNNLYSHTGSLIELTQLISAALPTIFGGQMESNETASGYSQARNAAMGRLQMFWSSIRHGHAALMLKAVNVFRNNRTEDAILPVLDESKEYVNQYVRLADLQGNITAEPETDEDFPVTWAEKRENLRELMQIIPGFAQIMLDPANAVTLRQLVGDTDIHIPQEASREKQYREIDILTKSAPMQIPTPPAMPGMPPQIQLQSTVQVQVETDDHQVEMMTIKEWCNSDKGLACKADNPPGFANVLAHYQEHQKAMMQQAAQQQALQTEIMAQMGLTPPNPAESAGRQADQAAAPEGQEAPAAAGAGQ